MLDNLGYRFSFGPWNIHEGADPFGPAVRETIKVHMISGQQDERSFLQQLMKEGPVKDKSPTVDDGRTDTRSQPCADLRLAPERHRNCHKNCHKMAPPEEACTVSPCYN